MKAALSLMEAWYGSIRLFASKAVQVPSRVHSESPGGPESGSPIQVRVLGPARAGSRNHSGWPDPGPGSFPSRAASRIHSFWVAQIRTRIRVPDEGPVPGRRSRSRIWVPSRPRHPHWLAETLQVAYLRSLRHDTGCARGTCKPEIPEPQRFLPALPRRCAARNVSRTTTNCFGSLLCLAMRISMRAPRGFPRAGRARACLSCNNLRPDVVRLPSQFVYASTKVFALLSCHLHGHKRTTTNCCGSLVAVYVVIALRGWIRSA